MIYVTSDIHGYPLPDFLRLLDRARFSDSDELIVLGDVIDRNGDGGIAMLRWMLQQDNVRLILGNHEAMLLACQFLFSEITDINLAKLDRKQIASLAHWMRNGAEPTLKALRSLFLRDQETAWGIVDYLLDAPLYETVEVPERSFVLTHAGLGNFRPDKKLSEYTADELIWYRPKPEEHFFQDRITVFGHTPTNYYGAEYARRMLQTPTWIDIDTGAGQGWPPMLLRLEDLTPFYQQE